MEFIDMNDSSAECILGVDVMLTETGCSIQWNYPIKYTEICIFAVNLSNEFNEQMAIAGNYKCYRMKYPEQKLNISGVVNFAIFPVNEKGQLIRQKKVLWNCNIIVNYEFRTEIEEAQIRGLKKLFVKANEKKHYFLIISSPINLPGKAILYTIKGKTGVFCIPSEVFAKRIHKFELSEPIEIFTEEKYISLKKINMCI